MATYSETSEKCQWLNRSRSLNVFCQSVYYRRAVVLPQRISVCLGRILLILWRNTFSGTLPRNRNMQLNGTFLYQFVISSHSHFLCSNIALSRLLRVAIVFCRFSRSASSTDLKLSIAFSYSVSVCVRLFDGGRSPIFRLSKARSLLVKAKSKLLRQFWTYENLVSDLFFSFQRSICRSIFFQ